jgi:multidrug efflux pump subunit AcrB
LPGQVDALYAAAEAIKAGFAEVPYSVNLYNDYENRSLRAAIEIDSNRARRAGVTNKEIASSLQVVLAGNTSTVLREGDEEIAIRSRAVDAERMFADRLFTTNIFSRTSSAVVPLVQIADVRAESAFAVRTRRDHAPTITVSASNTELTATELEAAMKDKIDTIVGDLGKGFWWEWGGESESQHDAQAALFAFVPLSLFGVLICLVGQFNSLKKPLVVLLTVPVAITGVAIGLIVGQGFNSFMALIGMLSLVGIVVNNAIVMLEQIAIEQEAGSDPYDAIIQACIG